MNQKQIENVKRIFQAFSHDAKQFENKKGSDKFLVLKIPLRYSDFSSESLRVAGKLNKTSNELSSTIDEFLSQKCTILPTYKTGMCLSKVYDACCAFLVDRGGQPCTRRRFSEYLIEKGFYNRSWKGRLGNRTRVFVIQNTKPTLKRKQQEEAKAPEKKQRSDTQNPEKKQSDTQNMEQVISVNQESIFQEPNKEKKSIAVEAVTKDGNSITVEAGAKVEKQFSRFVGKYFYIITSPLHLDKKVFKIGYWGGTLEGLRQRYITILPQVIIYWYVLTPHAKRLEAILKQAYSEERIPNEAKRKSEWITCDVASMIDFAKSFLLVEDKKWTFQECDLAQRKLDCPNIGERSHEPSSNSATKNEGARAEESTRKILHVPGNRRVVGTSVVDDESGFCIWKKTPKERFEKGSPGTFPTSRFPASFAIRKYRSIKEQDESQEIARAPPKRA